MENKVQNEVGHAAYGMFMALLSFSYIFGVFADMGLNQYTTKQLALSNQFKADYFPVLFPFKWLLAIVFPILMVAGGWLIGYNQKELYYLSIIALGYSLSFFISFFRSILQGTQHFNIDAVASVGERLGLLIIILFLFQLGLSLESYVYARLLSIIITFIGLFFIIKKYSGQFRYILSWQKIRYLLKASFPFAVIMLVYGINEKIDIIMVERLASDKEAGIYAAAYRWVDAVMMYIWTILPIFFAKFASNIKSRKGQEQLLQFGQVIIAVPLIFICVFVFYYGRNLFWQFSGSSAQEIDTMLLNLQLLFANVLVHGFFAIYSTLLAASNFEKNVSWLVAGSVAVNITLNAVFIPLYGSVASATITLICAGFLSLGYLVLVRKKIKIKIPVEVIIKLLSATLILMIIFKLLQTWSDRWLLNTIMAALFYLPLIFFLRIVRWHHLKAALIPKR